jgi:hypothetical protein
MPKKLTFEQATETVVKYNMSLVWNEEEFNLQFTAFFL